MEDSLTPQVLLFEKTAGVDVNFIFPNGGCQLSVNRNVKLESHNLYWLKDGVEKMHFNVTGLSGKDRVNINYRFENKERPVVFEAEGVYQCVADFDGLDAPIIGKTFNVTIHGIILL